MQIKTGNYCNIFQQNGHHFKYISGVAGVGFSFFVYRWIAPYPLQDYNRVQPIKK